LRTANDGMRRLLGCYFVPLNALDGTEDDGSRCTCQLIHHQTNLEPEEWDRDPECDQHGDIRYIKRERAEARALLMEAGEALLLVPLSPSQAWLPWEIAFHEK